MKAVLFVSNGHGEVAIAQRIASALEQTSKLQCDHLALVGGYWEPHVFRQVGPRRPLPSGGLIAMGNLRNIARDLGAGLLTLTIAQRRFLRSVRGQYAAVVAVGDVFALAMALQTRSPTVFVGTAKSVYVAAYGLLERTIIRKARAIFVRDAATASDLGKSGIAARPANVIADLADNVSGASASAANGQLALFPGSRESAYEDARFICGAVRKAAETRADLRAVLSIAPGLESSRFSQMLRADGWTIEERDDPDTPFSALENGRELIRARTGSGEALLRTAQLVVGQAGTANEAAAAAGIAVIAFVPKGQRKKWYRRRQVQLLGDAMLLVERDTDAGARAILELLSDEQRRVHMGRVGRERMGPPGASRAIADEILRLCA